MNAWLLDVRPWQQVSTSKSRWQLQKGKELQNANTHWTPERVSEEASKLLKKAINRPRVSKVLKESSRWLSVSGAEGSRKKNRFEKLEEGRFIAFKQVISKCYEVLLACMV